MTAEQYRLGLVLAVLLLIANQCSNGAGMAGATGAGNPRTAVSLAMVADTGVARMLAGLAKRVVDSSPLSEEEGVARSLPIRDMGMLEYGVESALLVVDRVQFMLQTPGSVEEDAVGTGLGYDGKSITLDGPFVFDAIAGTVEPAIDDVLLPQTGYSGIKLHINQNHSSEVIPYAIVIAGTFTYGGEERRFSLNLKTNVNAVYQNSGGVFDLVGEDAAALRVVFDASLWLQSVGLGTCIDSGWIPLDTGGNLVVDGTMPPSPCRGKLQEIRRNVIESGTLVVALGVGESVGHASAQ